MILTMLLATADEGKEMTMLFAAVHESAFGTELA